MPKSVLANLVVTCSNRKAAPATPALDLARVAAKDPDRRLEEWVRRLSRGEGSGLPAISLYKGGAWGSIRRLCDDCASKGRPVQIWVCSAGYGLIRATARILPYAATFGLGKPESICLPPGGIGAMEAHRGWWSGLSRWAGPQPGEPRSLEAVARAFPRTPLIVAASDRYLHALEPDLSRAAARLRDVDQLCIISAGTDRLEWLSDHLMPIDGRLRTLVGGTMHELNVRLAWRVLTKCDPSSLCSSKLRQRFMAWMHDTEPLERFDRTPMDDEEVRRFIRQRLRRNPDLRPSPLLRQLRDSGRACEQKRFSVLFNQVQQTYALFPT